LSSREQASIQAATHQVGLQARGHHSNIPVHMLEFDADLEVVLYTVTSCQSTPCMCWPGEIKNISVASRVNETEHPDSYPCQVTDGATKSSIKDKKQGSRSLLAVHGKVYTRTTTSPPAAAALPQLCRALRLLVTRPHGLYLNLALRHDYSSLGRTCSMPTLPCAATTHHPATRALGQPRRAPRILVSTLPAAAIYFDYVVRLGASARRAARHAARRAARRRLLCLAQARR
jgi:hypothetical protein